MAAQSSPVTPSVLRWAVEEDGRPHEALAERLKVDVDVLDAWLNGEALPSKGEVTRLADALKRPRAVFFLPRPPEGATLPPSFRHPPGDARQVSPTARNWVRRARRVQHALAWATHDEQPVELPRATFRLPPPAAAAEAREWLGVTDEQQRRWRDDYEALRGWRESLEMRDILVFALDIGPGEVRGFSAWDDRAPLIVTNTSRVTPAARIFTLGHELGHLVTRSDAACLEADEADLSAGSVERWCEEFAASLLMPAEQVRDIARSRGIANRAADLDDVTAIKNRFRVSGRAAARRLIDLGYAQESLYGAVVKTFVAKAPKADATFFSPPRPEARLRQYGPRAIRTLMESLPPRDALSMLRITVDDARELAERVPGVPVF
jgi:Zn-dependent peptidase ImmA (M78 family)